MDERGSLPFLHVLALAAARFGALPLQAYVLMAAFRSGLAASSRISHSYALTDNMATDSRPRTSQQRAD